MPLSRQVVATTPTGVWLRTAVHDQAGAAGHRPLLQRYLARELHP